MNPEDPPKQFNREENAADPADVFRQSMQEALAHLDRVNAETQAAQAKAVDEQIAARQALADIERNAEQLTAQFMEQHRREIEARIRAEVEEALIKKLILGGVPSFALKKILDMDPARLADIWMDMGFEKLGDHVIHVRVEDQGRGGYVQVALERDVLRWWWEIGGGHVLAIIDIPGEDQWERDTRLPLADRPAVLDHVAREVLRQKAPNALYTIEGNVILIIPVMDTSAD